MPGGTATLKGIGVSTRIKDPEWRKKMQEIVKPESDRELEGRQRKPCSLTCWLFLP